MRLLGIDTATWRASVALLDGPVRVAGRSLVTRGNHAATLLPLVEEVLQEAGWERADLDGIGVGAGPGSFTGVRVGLGVARGLAWALGIPVLGVSSLEALALSVDPASSDPVAAVLDARKGELYAGVYRREGEGLSCVVPDALFTPARLLDFLPRPLVVVGDAVESYGGWWREHFGDAIRLHDIPDEGAPAAAVARLAAARLDPLPSPFPELEARYLRPCDAERKRAEMLENTGGNEGG